MIECVEVEGVDNLYHFFIDKKFVFEVVTESSEVLGECGRAILAMKRWHEMQVREAADAAGGTG